MRYAKTQYGLQAMKDRTLSLTAKQRAALVLCDAKRSRDQVLYNLKAVGSNIDDITFLKSQGLVMEVSDPQEEAAAEAARKLASVAPTERYSSAYPIATKLTSTLGLKRFTLTLALERASSYEELCSVATKLRAIVPREAYSPLHQALYQ